MDLIMLQSVGVAVLRDLQRHLGLDPDTTDGSLATFSVSASVMQFPDDPEIEDVYRLAFQGFEYIPFEQAQELAHLAAQLVVSQGVPEPVTIAINDDPDAWVTTFQVEVAG